MWAGVSLFLLLASGSSSNDETLTFVFMDGTKDMKLAKPPRKTKWKQKKAKWSHTPHNGTRVSNKDKCVHNEETPPNTNHSNENKRQRTRRLWKCKKSRLTGIMCRWPHKITIWTLWGASAIKTSWQIPAPRSKSGRCIWPLIKCSKASSMCKLSEKTATFPGIQQLMTPLRPKTPESQGQNSPSHEGEHDRRWGMHWTNHGWPRRASWVSNKDICMPSSPASFLPFLCWTAPMTMMQCPQGYLWPPTSERQIYAIVVSKYQSNFTVHWIRLPIFCDMHFSCSCHPRFLMSIYRQPCQKTVRTVSMHCVLKVWFPRMLPSRITRNGQHAWSHCSPIMVHGYLDTIKYSEW